MESECVYEKTIDQLIRGIDFEHEEECQHNIPTFNRYIGQDFKSLAIHKIPNSNSFNEFSMDTFD